MHAVAAGCSSAHSQPHLLVHLFAFNSFVDEVDCSMNTLKRKRENPDPSVPPPPGWKRLFSESCRREYFLHVESKHTQWEYPSRREVENPIEAKKRRVDAESKRADALRREKREEEKHQQLQRSYEAAIRKRNGEAGEASFCVGSINSSIHLYHFVLIFYRCCCCCCC